MIFEQNKPIEKTAKKLGFIFSFLLFTTILYFILNISKHFYYLDSALIVLSIVIIGTIIKRGLM